MGILLFASYIPFLITSLIYLGILFLIGFMIYKWVNRFITLKQEQNDLLREIINKMESR